MTALVSEKAVSSRNGLGYSDPVAAAATIHRGALVCLNAAGEALPGGAAGAAKTRGVAVDRGADNADGVAGDIKVETRRGEFLFENSVGADEIDRTHIGDPAYIVDDQTVAVLDTGGRIAAGTIRDIAENGSVWVEV